MEKIYTALGLMSGTSGDGVDASIISTNGIDQYSEILNKYFKYDQKIYENLHKLRDKIFKFDLSSIFFPSLKFVPANLTTRGTDNLIAFAASNTP